MSAKCPSCGLVNFVDATICRRCNTSLADDPNASWGASPPSGQGYDPGYGGYSGGYDSGFGGGAPGAQPQDPYGTWGSPGQSASGPDPGVGQPGNWQPGATFQGPPGFDAPGYGAAPGYGQAQNPYAAPGTMYGGNSGYGYGYSVVGVPTLASRVSRLGAHLLDGLIATPLAVPVVIGAIAGNQAALVAGILVTVALAIVLLIVQLVMLANRGQTIGKRILGIKIVKIDTYENGGFVTNILMRGFVAALPGLVPYIGSVYSLVDILFIFRADQRCIHDLIASTVVVEA